VPGPLLQIDNLSIDFLAETDVTHAVKRLSLSVDRGEIVALVGESGSGKSVTALSILQLLPAPPARYSSGSVLFSDTDEAPVDLLELGPASLQKLRGNAISMIFQEPMTSLNPVMTCGRQVAETLLQHRALSAREIKERVIHWFNKVQLPGPEQMFDRYPHQLSGGQKQRVMIAMAMCCEPSLLICDEPTTALDVTVQQTILLLIKQLQQEQNMGVIFITHDLGVVSEIADRVAIMYRGAIVEAGATRQVFRSATHPYTKALINCRPALHPKGARLPMVADFMDGARVSNTPAQPASGQSPQRGEAIVTIENLSVQFATHTNIWGKTTSAFKAVDNVSLSLYKGETLGLVGESGCGKTTLGRTLLRLISPSSGRVIYKDRDVATLTGAQEKELRKNVQLVFQDPYSSLNPRMTVGAALVEPMRVTGSVKGSRAQQARLSELLSLVSLPANAAGRYPHEFSGGQRQRIVIARALSLNPSLLVCDESVSALDVSVQAQVLNLLNDLKSTLDLTLIFISHDLSVVRYMSDRIAVMQEGRIVELGEATSVYTHPQQEYTKKLLSAVPQLTAEAL
jgi:peptide/nickel transport system ATP-binding protein